MVDSSKKRESAKRISLILVFSVIGLSLVFYFHTLETVKASSFEPSYILIDNETGGDCTLIGNWEEQTKTCTIDRDLVLYGQGILIAADGVTLDGAGHTITGSGTDYGVSVFRRKDVTLTNLVVEGFGEGQYRVTEGAIDAESTTNLRIINNIASDNRFQGIHLYASTGALVSGNQTFNNHLGGISLYQASGNLLTGNISSDNYLGIWLSESGSNTIASNQVTANTYNGVHLDRQSDNNVIRTNSISANRYFGLSLTESVDNLVYGNEFLGNNLYSSPDHVQAYGTAENFFNLPDPIGGNYWDDWLAPDENGDGFVDYEYEISSEAGLSGGRDALPRIEPVSCVAPRLRLGRPIPFWSSYADYLERQLSVTYTISNGTEAVAMSISIIQVDSSNGVMLLSTYPAPFEIGTGGQMSIILRYQIPSGVEAFTTSIHATAEDICGNQYIYPGNYP